MLKELQELLGELYELYGATTQVVRLSQIVDYLAYEAHAFGIDPHGYSLNRLILASYQYGMERYGRFTKGIS